MKQFKIPCSLFSIAVYTAPYGILCLFSNADCCSQLSVTSQHTCWGQMWLKIFGL